MHWRFALALVAVLALAAAACQPEEGDPLTDDPATPTDETPGETPTPDEEVDLAGDPDTTVVEVLEDSGEFTALLDALEQAGLAGELSGEGPVTVFAPTDEAFDRLPEAQQDLLAGDPRRPG